jgi:hypothetical protein
LPYYKRFPFQEMLQREHAMKANPPDQIAEPDENFLKLADSVLAEDSGASPDVEGPFHLLKPLKAGETGQMILTLENVASDAPETLNLSPNDLLSANGGRIGRSGVRITPSSFTIPPGGSKDVQVSVITPKEAKPGTYTGAIAVSGRHDFGIQITAEVR